MTPANKKINIFLRLWPHVALVQKRHNVKVLSNNKKRKRRQSQNLGWCPRQSQHGGVATIFSSGKGQNATSWSPSASITFHSSKKLFATWGCVDWLMSLPHNWKVVSSNLTFTGRKVNKVGPTRKQIFQIFRHREVRFSECLWLRMVRPWVRIHLGGK